MGLGFLKGFLGNMRGDILPLGVVMKILVCMLGIGGGGAERVLVDFFQSWEHSALSGGGIRS